MTMCVFSCYTVFRHNEASSLCWPPGPAGRVRLMNDIIINFASALKVSTDEILGVRSLPESPVSSLRLVKRLKKIENKNIDMFLKAAESDD